MAEPISTSSVQMARALYDYSYEDDHSNLVIMKAGEIYHLLNADGSDWWQVKRPNTLNTFYVPRTYVEVVGADKINNDVQEEKIDSGFSGSQGSIDQEDSHQHIQVTSTANETNFQSKNGLTSFKPKMGDDNSESLYINYNGGGKNVTSIQVQYHGKVQCPTDIGPQDGGDYANLDDLRAASGMKQPGGGPYDESPDSDLYANLQQLNIQPPGEPASPPLPEQSKYQKTIMDKWDMYLDPETNRVFYVHKDTKERNWKPPRDKNMPGTFHNELYKQRSRSSGEYEEVISPVSPLTSSSNSYPRNRKSRSLDYGRPFQMPLIIPEGWGYDVNEEGRGVFINEVTNEKRLSEENLPTKSPTEDIPNALPKSNSQTALNDQRSIERSQVSDRFRKSRSVMIENLHFQAPSTNLSGPPPPKSATLPPNFQTAIPEVAKPPKCHGLLSYRFHDCYLKSFRSVESLDGVGSRKDQRLDNPHPVPPFSQSCQLNEPIEGVLNKVKIEKGKAGKKTTSYVKLEGTNLVFHQIQKKNKPGQIESMVPLQTCTIEKNPKEMTNRKHTILISTEETAPQTLLLFEDDGKMMEWFVRLQMKIKEVGGPEQPEPGRMSPQQERQPSFRKGKGHTRSDSRSDANASKSSLKEYLQTFFTKRKNIQEIEDKGIYKNAVFGAELKQLCDKEKVKVPNFVTRCVEAIEKRGLDHEGIYRITGNVSQIQKLRCMVDQDEPYNLDDPVWDMNVLTGALKLFFRELKEPLFTFSLFDRFLSSYMKDLNSERLKAIRNAVNELPKCHYETVKFLFKHLTKITDESKENKMQSHQLAIVFGPTLIWPQVQTSNLATSMVYQSRIVEYVLVEYKNIFR